MTRQGREIQKLPNSYGTGSSGVCRKEHLDTSGRLVVGIFASFLICHVLLHAGVLSHVSAKDTLAPGEKLSSDTGDYLESSNQRFRLRFVGRPGSTSSWYLCIQLTQYVALSTSEETAIWVAWSGESQAFPPYLTMDEEGHLVVSTRNAFVVNKEQHVGTTLWQSFDRPANTWLPGMKMGWFGLKTRQPRQRLLTSWTSEENPSPGAFTLGVDPNNTKQIVAMHRGLVYWQSGEWSGTKFRFLDGDFPLRYFSNHNDSYFVLDGNSSYIATVLAMGKVKVRIKGKFKDIYTISGCYSDKFYNNKGCIRPKQYNCSVGDWFNSTNGVIDGVWEQYLFSSGLGISDCKEICETNCSCNAYAAVRTDGTGCKFSSSTAYHYVSNGEVLYIRNAKTDHPPTALENRKSHNMRTTMIAALTAAPLVTLAMIFIVWYMNPRKCCRTCFRAPIVNSRQQLGDKEDEELPFFPFKSIEIATNYFSNENKLGEGGFGHVYKAWDLWIEGRVSDLIDQAIDHMVSTNEATRCIQIGLLCVQETAADRPTMSDVVSMLGTESIVLPTPKQHGFSNVIGSKYDNVGNNPITCSVNNVTISEIEGR
nr:G-type lectin S-receptor-like serine/threonine-protein kinase At1g67520 [Ipomoea batatas]